ncbi:MAG: LUD domain-containing protein, partial [Deltaproteobacteria bacterium]|nr:LUD domain-containing protein [Deltaproteobacteria bacterium]
MDRLTVINRIFFGSKGAAMENTSKDSLSKAFDTVIKRQGENKARLPLSRMRERLVKNRTDSVGNGKLLGEAIENLEKNGFRVREVEGIEEALGCVVEEIGRERLVVKSKSNLSKEMRLREAMAGKGIEVVETDIGDRIVQFADCRPTHPTGPASHLSVEEIAAIVSEETGEIPSTAEDIIEVLLSDIKKALAAARVGITGVNAIAAREGSVVIAHNEGNVSEILRLPGKLIMLADTNKIYENIEDSLNMVKLQTYYATGAVTTSQINIVSGPTKTADIEKKLFYGIHGPKEMVLILVRRDVREDFSEVSRCIGCGGCILECPVYLAKGASFGTYYKQGGIGTLESGLKQGAKASVENGLYDCTRCGACVMNCPASIDIPSFVTKMREVAAEEEETRSVVKPYRALARSVVFASSVKGVIKKLNPLSAQTVSGIAYFPGCVSTVSTPGLKKDITDIIRKISGKEPRIIEGCCGGVYESLGFKKDYEAAFERFLKGVEGNPPEKIIVSCPHCYDVLWNKKGERLKSAGVGEVLRMTEFVLSRLPADAVTRKYREDGKRQKIAYHDSCIFGRGFKLYDEPRKILERLCGGSFEMVETERERERGLCCGFSLSASAPILARALAGKVNLSARNSGADILVTSGCPGCFHALKNAGAGHTAAGTH